MPLSNFLQDPNKIAVSTAAQLFIEAPGRGSVRVGVVQTLEPSQDRSTTPVRGIGIGDRILQRVWNLTDYKLNVTKMALFQKNLIQILGYDNASGPGGFRMLAQLRFPIDIKEVMLQPDGSPIHQTVYHGCYLTSFSAPKNIGGDIIITESASFDCTYVSDGLADPFNYEFNAWGDGVL
jgi:hypothetical protein